MATRCNIFITGHNGNKLWLYRHWDGYAASTGADIAKKLKHLSRGFARQRGSFAPLANALLADRYDPTPHEPNKPIYEITSGEHGDIEWKYVVSCRQSGSVSIEVHELNLRTDEWKCHGKFSEKEFRSFCAREVMDMLKRMRAYRSKRAA